jgi:thiol-disulfide isomerase/thioredoxin
MLKARIVLPVIVLCGLMACNSNDPPSSTRRPGTNAPPNTAFPMPPLNGGSLNTLGWTGDGGKRSVFSDFRGKVLVLDFYATWCVPCRDSIPHLVELQKKHEAEGLQVIGLNVGGPDDPPKAPAFAKEFGIQYPLAMPDDDLVMFLMADSNAIPQTFVFDREGKLAQRLIGFAPGDDKIIDQAVEAALQIPAQ